MKLSPGYVSVTCIDSIRPLLRERRLGGGESRCHSARNMKRPAGLLTRGERPRNRTRKRFGAHCVVIQTANGVMELWTLKFSGMLR